MIATFTHHMVLRFLRFEDLLLMTYYEINTERLRLRRWTEGDHAPFAEMCSDADVMRYIGDGSTRNFEQACQSIRGFEREWNERGYGLFAVDLKHTHQFIGFTGFSYPKFLPEILPSIEIGWRFSKSNWGLGYASEAAHSALEFGLDKIGFRDVVSIYQTKNQASARIMQKLGMVFDRKTIDPSCDRDIEVYRLP